MGVHVLGHKLLAFGLSSFFAAWPEVYLPSSRSVIIPLRPSARYGHLMHS